MRQPNWRRERNIVIHLRRDSLTLPETRVRMCQPNSLTLPEARVRMCQPS